MKPQQDQGGYGVTTRNGPVIIGLVANQERFTVMGRHKEGTPGLVAEQLDHALRQGFRLNQPYHLKRGLIEIQQTGNEKGVVLQKTGAAEPALGHAPM